MNFIWCICLMPFKSNWMCCDDDTRIGRSASMFFTAVNLLEIKGKSGNGSKSININIQHLLQILSSRFEASNTNSITFSLTENRIWSHAMQTAYIHHSWRVRCGVFKWKGPSPTQSCWKKKLSFQNMMKIVIASNVAFSNSTLKLFYFVWIFTPSMVFITIAYL